MTAGGKILSRIGRIVEIPQANQVGLRAVEITKIVRADLFRRARHVPDANLVNKSNPPFRKVKVGPATLAANAKRGDIGGRAQQAVLFSRQDSVNKEFCRVAVLDDRKMMP